MPYNLLIYELWLSEKLKPTILPRVQMKRRAHLVFFFFVPRATFPKCDFMGTKINVLQNFDVISSFEFDTQWFQ